MTAATPPAQRHPALSSVEEILADARNGRMVVLVDDEDRENEGDLVIPAQMVTPDVINFMAKYGRGLICLALTTERVRELDLPLMSANNGTRHETAFTVSIEARDGVTTGISAADRARTIQVAIDGTKGKEHIVTPGHVFPLAARPGGTLVRAGHTEAAVDISRLAGLNPSGVICEIMNDDGTMARLPDLIAFAQHHGLKVGTIADLIAYRRRHDHLIACVGETRFHSLLGGEWRARVYVNKAEYSEHLVLIKGQPDTAKPVLVRMHAMSIFEDILGEDNGRAGQLQRSMRAVTDEGAGYVVVIRDVRPTRLSEVVGQREGQPAQIPEMDQRDYGIGAQILVDLGIQQMVLLTNSPGQHYVALEGYGLQVVGERPIPPINDRIRYP